MAIAVSCPKCKKQLALNEKWAGKRVACSGCKNPVQVPKLLDLDDDEPENEDRRGKPKSNAALIGSIVGFVTLVLLVVVYLIFGGKARENVEKAKAAQEERDRPKPRKVELAEANQLLTRIASGYINFSSKAGRGPNDLKELALQSDARAVELVIDKKWISVPFGGEAIEKLTLPPSAMILAYETEASKGKRAVVLADGKTREMDEDTFNNHPKMLGAAPAAVGDPQTPKGKFVPQMGISRFKERLKIQNWLRDLGTAYVIYTIQNSKTPAKLQDLKIADAELLQAINGGDVKVQWNLPVAEVEVHLIAYEVRADANGKRVVVIGQTAKEVDEEEFVKLVSK